MGAHGEVAQGCHDAGCGAGADAGGVLTEDDVAFEVKDLDAPFPAHGRGVGVVGGKAGDAQDPEVGQAGWASR